MYTMTHKRTQSWQDTPGSEHALIYGSLNYKLAYTQIPESNYKTNLG